MLKAASERNYRITAPEVAMLTPLSLEDARRYLEALARGGVVSVELGDNGMLVYCFADAKY